MSEAKFTKGPWAWFGNANGNQVYLATTHSGRRYVMQFRRWGMRGAQPVFQPTQGMVEAKNLLKFEVGDRSVTGVDEAKANSSVYRTDIRGIAAPDAHLIAAAPELYEALRMAAKDLNTAAHLLPDIGPALLETVKQAHAALAKARGEA
ncbi:hypothetical protein [Gluconobacter albidus]|uniref:Uncharacterized protein n=1 Tax=Gluconobacter albidus TaxID=318683 RepID=A0AAW3QXZ1_9PROT|nr:hypothetical protein [Gluconobacter albidus]KXV39491.1 hypothetical protein AD941_05260 [Gluconobacter albidus]GBQ90823.1 hypothetical protein AA3250_2133 [Gluconobacter albidus NBRC 3250]GLQ69398.1 hypothetical protein GCM10007866_18490 [Gluconobacter albidus]